MYITLKKKKNTIKQGHWDIDFYKIIPAVYEILLTCMSMIVNRKNRFTCIRSDVT